MKEAIKFRKIFLLSDLIISCIRDYVMSELLRMKWIFRRWRGEPFTKLSAKLQMKTTRRACSL